ncbi:MAG: Asp-tRNA(Asn)/Glu-tRNA(Gln) amidotransferase subunit GatC [Bacilli bacterium]|jgi:aspartyl/glutamyl-tRNA(Asn/Gln) amidotransferase C subunit
MDKKIIKELASELYLSLTPEEEKEFSEQFSYFKAQAALLERIPHIDDVEATLFPHVEKRTYLRDDEVVETLPVDEILSNSKNAKDGFVIVPKVVK